MYLKLRLLMPVVCALALAACSPATTYDQAVLPPAVFGDGTLVQTAFNQARVDGPFGHTVTNATTGVDFSHNGHHGIEQVTTNTVVGNNAGVGVAGLLGPVLGAAVGGNPTFNNSATGIGTGIATSTVNVP